MCVCVCVCVLLGPLLMLLGPLLIPTPYGHGHGGRIHGQINFQHSNHQMCMYILWSGFISNRHMIAVAKAIVGGSGLFVCPLVITILPYWILTLIMLLRV